MILSGQPAVPPGRNLKHALLAVHCWHLQVPRAGKSTESFLPEGPFTLITGCESHQTSGDTGSGGVMTTALCGVVRAMKEQDPEAPLSAR